MSGKLQHRPFPCLLGDKSDGISVLIVSGSSAFASSTKLSGTECRPLLERDSERVGGCGGARKGGRGGEEEREGGERKVERERREREREREREEREREREERRLCVIPLLFYKRL